MSNGIEGQSRGVSLDQFVQELHEEVDKFRDLWLKMNQKDPEKWPLVIPEENAGVWIESFLTMDDWMS